MNEWMIRPSIGPVLTGPPGKIPVLPRESHPCNTSSLECVCVRARAHECVPLFRGTKKYLHWGLSLWCYVTYSICTSLGPFLRLQLENDMLRINRVYLCNYKLYVHYLGITIKVTLVRFHQTYKHHYWCNCVRVNADGTQHKWKIKMVLLERVETLLSSGYSETWHQSSRCAGFICLFARISVYSPCIV